MIFFYVIQLIRKIIWLFRIPKPEQVAYIDENAHCPVCAASKGRLRCVVQVKQGPRPEKDILPPMKVVCQHTCEKCGARWFDPPISRKATPETVLPSVPRTELEQKEDRAAMMQAQAENPN
jgi:hypothetical protein